MGKWRVEYNMKLDRELDAPTLPRRSATLAEQKAVVRALKVLYPGIKIRLFSIRTRGDTRVVLELQV